MVAKHRSYLTVCDQFRDQGVSVLQDALRRRLAEKRRDGRVVIERQDSRPLQVRRKQILIAQPEFLARLAGPCPDCMAVEAVDGNDTKIRRQELRSCIFWSLLHHRVLTSIHFGESCEVCHVGVLR